MGQRVHLVCVLGLLRACVAQDQTADAGSTPKPEAILFDALPVVEAASLHTQSLMEAPASVTVISDEDIRQRGYRTLAEALADVRGFYVSYDRVYQFVGVRGFSLPGDYNTRFLMMINGHSLTENVYSSAGYFGQDFGLDMDLIKRIEIIRGPSSALYGSNGMFATINIVTKSPVEYQALRVSAETDSLGERKVEVSSSQYLGKGANLLISASAFNNIGQSLYFPQFDSPETNHGVAVNMDGEKGYHTFANLFWRGWSVLAYFNDREKQVPTAWYGTVFNGRGTKVLDGRGFVEAAYQRNVGAAGKLQWRISYDQYRYAGRYDLPGDQPTDDRDGAKGDWLSTRLTYQFRPRWRGYMTVGSEGSWDLRTLQLYYQVSPAYENLLHINVRDRSKAVFFQQEWSLSTRWTLYVGGRLDDSRNHPVSLTPRLALVYQPSQASAVKLLYGRSFRNPNSFEQFYDDSGASQIPNPALQPEQMQTFEVAFERRLSKRLGLLANVYRYQLDNMITAVPVSSDYGLQQYRNGATMHSTGVELEATAEVGSRFKLDASLAAQRSAYGAYTGAELNSPARVGKLLFDSRWFGGRFSMSSALQYMSSRRTFSGDSVADVYLVNLSFALHRLPGGLELHFGVRNLLDRVYWDPANVNQGMDSIQQDGRSFFARLSWSPHPEVKPGSGGGARNGKP